MGISVLLKNPETAHAEITAFAELTEHAEEGLAFLSYINGFLTAVIVGPEFVPPGDWLPCMVDPLATSGKIEDVQIATNLILLEYHKILSSLAAREKAYEPFFWRDEDERVVTTDWAQGFMAGAHLRFDAWTAFLEGDYRIFTIILGVLLQSEEVTAKLTEAGLDSQESFDKACEEAPLFIEEFYDCWAKRRPANSHPLMYRESKVGRNDPCPCGSGKKYKKCCLN